MLSRGHWRAFLKFYMPEEVASGKPARELVEAVAAELAAFLARHGDLELPDGGQRVARRGHDPARPIQTGSDRSRRRSRRRAIVGRGQTSASAIRRRSCRNGLGGPRASTFLCRLFSRPCSIVSAPVSWGFARFDKYLFLQERRADQLGFLQIEWRLWA